MLSENDSKECVKKRRGERGTGMTKKRMRGGKRAMGRGREDGV